MLRSHVPLLQGADLARRWMAPEVLLFNKFRHASDVWSFGITIVECFQTEPGTLPFYFMEVRAMATMFESPVKCNAGTVELGKELIRSPPGDIRELVDQCLKHDAESRPSFAAIVTVLTDNLQGTARWYFTILHTILGASLTLT